MPVSEAHLTHCRKACLFPHRMANIRTILEIANTDMTDSKLIEALLCVYVYEVSGPLQALFLMI